MLQYLIILLSDRSTSFCHYSPGSSPKGEGSCTPIPLDTLRRGIRFAMRENLMIQFVYPEEELPREILDEIETIDHSKIRPLEGREKDADVLVLNGWETERLGDFGFGLQIRSNGVRRAVGAAHSEGRAV